MGKNVAMPLSLQMKKNDGGYEKEFMYQLPMKKLQSSLNDLDWPLNPVDTLGYLIKCLWPSEDDADNSIDCSMLGSGQEAWERRKELEKAAWDDEKRAWWLRLSEPMRKILLSIYAEVAERFSDVDPLPQYSDTKQIPLDALSHITEPLHQHFRGKVMKVILMEMKPVFVDSLFKTYFQQASQFCDMICEHYSQIYGETDPELNTKVLLDVFLEVIADWFTCAPEMTS